MRKVHLFLVLLTLLGLSGCKETPKESKTSTFSSRKVTPSSSTTVSVKTNDGVDFQNKLYSCGCFAQNLFS